MCDSFRFLTRVGRRAQAHPGLGQVRASRRPQGCPVGVPARPLRPAPSCHLLHRLPVSGGTGKCGAPHGPASQVPAQTGGRAAFTRYPPLCCLREVAGTRSPRTPQTRPRAGGPTGHGPAVLSRGPRRGFRQAPGEEPSLLGRPSREPRAFGTRLGQATRTTGSHPFLTGTNRAINTRTRPERASRGYRWPLCLLTPPARTSSDSF